MTKIENATSSKSKIANTKNLAQYYIYLIYKHASCSYQPDYDMEVHCNILKFCNIAKTSKVVGYTTQYVKTILNF